MIVSLLGGSCWICLFRTNRPWHPLREGCCTGRQGRITAGSQKAGTEGATYSRRFESGVQAIALVETCTLPRADMVYVYEEQTVPWQVDVVANHPANLSSGQEAQQLLQDTTRLLAAGGRNR